MRSSPSPRNPTAAPPIFYVCGDTARSPARSGIQTVVRSLLAAFGTGGSPVRPVVWEMAAADLRPLPPTWSLGLGAEPLRDPPTRLRSLLSHPASWPAALLAHGHSENLPLHRHPYHQTAPRGSWVLLPELLYHERSADQLVDYVHRRGWRLAAILHDTIPVQHPEFVPSGLPADHARYLRALGHADLILPNSEATARGWREFIDREKLRSPPVRVCTLACDLPGIPRVRDLPPVHDPSPGNPIRLLCVSTLESRKNHRTLLAAYELALARRPDLPLALDLVGAAYVSAPDIADAVRTLAARYPDRVRWHERTEHAALQRLYADCDFTVYPSVLEGFGIPVIESLWFARPCICANFGVMAENAVGGGCLTTDVRDAAALADAILQLSAAPTLRQRLAQETVKRRLKTWREYADEILERMEDEG